MRTRSTPWHTLLPALLLAACGTSHSPTDCPEVLGSCMDRCCVSSGAPSFDAECNPSCPAGTSLRDRCVPGPECLACGGVDAGPPPRCTGGACCDQYEPAILRADCSSSCPPGYDFWCEPDPAAFCAAPWLSCEQPPDCTLAPVGCCLSCGEITLDDVTAVSVSGRAAYFEMVCPDDGACPPCVPPSAPTLIATCSAGACQALDVRRETVSACAIDADCRVRIPDCCECGADVREDNLIAIHIDQGGEYARLVCDLGDPSCRPCGAVYPPSVEAFCAGDGHCAVRPTP